MDAGGVVKDLTDGLPIKSNAAWGRVCYDIDISTFGTGDNFVECRWTFAKSGKFLELNGQAGEWLEAYLSDDLSGLVSHTFMVQGFRASL